MIKTIDQMTDMARSIGMNVGEYRISLLSVVSAMLILLFILVIVRVSMRAIKWLLRRNSAVDETQRLLIEKLTSILLFGMGILVAVDLLGIDLTALTVFSGALGLAVGFGLQKTVGNLIAGIILLMDRSIKPGDIIVVGDMAAATSAGTGTIANVGRVVEIGVRAASIVTRDGKKHLIPNEVLMTQPVENWSYSSREVRVRMRIPVGYDADLRLAQRLIVEVARANPRVLDDPEPMVWITAFGDRAVEHELRVWIGDPELGLGNVQGEIYLGIWDAFAAHAIALPLPRLEVAMHKG